MNEKLEILRARLLMYYRAEKAILTGQSYEIEGLKLTRADLGKVIQMIAELEDEIRRIEAESGFRVVRSRIRYVVPADGANMYKARRILR
ncbi:MAG: hypothetical protein IJP89_10115 [Synergistaceae bacterium]|nr:hypothetical protein [Synergistaceae bacterium]